VDERLIEEIVPEIREALVGLAFRNAFQLSDERFALAFEGDEFRLLLIAIEPQEPRIYLIRRRLREIKKEQANPSKFTSDLVKEVGGKRVIGMEKVNRERVVEIRLNGLEPKTLVAQLTGKSANLFLLDAGHKVISAARKPGSDEQSIGAVYSPPTRSSLFTGQTDKKSLLSFNDSRTLSETLDEHFQKLDEKESFETLAAAARRKNRNEISKLRRLAKNLEADLAQHGDAEKWKRYGDLLLANQSSAERKGDFVFVKDLFEESAPTIGIEVDENDSLPDAAQKYFRKYTKARNAAAEIGLRLESIQVQIDKAERSGAEIENAIDSRDIEFLKNLVDAKQPQKSTSNRRPVPRLPPGIRSFHSTDGFEILVGKKAVDNDVLTFKVAQSRDTWMHAADYPGSHVVIRNPDRKEIPQRTMMEAAQLAAFYSQGKKQPKAAVHFTVKKFVNKPKGAVPGLVRLASFKTILVEPVFPNVSPN
jgi:predicted ribosome quality control (RQC) complex YloA/Tae2 family protein